MAIQNDNSNEKDLLEEQTIKPYTITVIDATDEYYTDILHLCDERYGEGYISHDTYDKWLCCPQLFKVALADGCFAGFSVMLPATTEEIISQLGMLREDIEVAGQKPALIYKSGAVLPKYGRHGVMTAMATSGMETAKQMGFGTIVTSAWIHGGQIPIQKVLNKFGFMPLYDRKGLWYHLEDYYCIVCKGRCVCDARIFQKIL